jgi:hypothetical protein
MDRTKKERRSISQLKMFTDQGPAPAPVTLKGQTEQKNQIWKKKLRGGTKDSRIIDSDRWKKGRNGLRETWETKKNWDCEA